MKETNSRRLEQIALLLARTYENAFLKWKEMSSKVILQISEISEIIFRHKN